MLVAEDLDIGRWLQRRPLIHPILHESLLLTAVLIVFHVVEHLVIGLVKGETFAASVPHIGGGGLAGLACVAAIIFIALIPFFSFKHISRQVGETRMKEMLFGTSVEVPEGGHRRHLRISDDRLTLEGFDGERRKDRQDQV
jgi:hypothetical protein